MSFSKADLPYLKWSLGAFVLSLALSGGLLSISEKYQEQAQQERQAAQKQLTEARAQLSATENDQENMATYALEYNALLAQKIIGNEQRLDWMEGLEKIRQQGQVLDFKYTIAPQQAYVPNPPVDAGNFQLSRSDMSMQIDLLHEEQLIRLLAAMRAQMNGWFMLDGCTLARTDIANVNSPLKAECSGGWFTMKNKNAP
jgi:hypothetical protein